MQILQEVKKSFYLMGFDPKLKRFEIIRRIKNDLIIMYSTVISQYEFLIQEADGAEEYMESIYVVTLSTGFLLSYTSTILTTEKLFSLFRVYDEFMNTSK